MKMLALKKITMACLFNAAMIGCVTNRELIVSVPVASMSQTSIPKGKAVTQGKPGTVKFCQGNKAISTKESTVGLLDELIKRGEVQSKSRYLTDVQLFTSTEGSRCFELDFKAGVIVSASAVPKEASQPEEVN
jgi:hypothetical protein